MDYKFKGDFSFIFLGENFKKNFYEELFFPKNQG